MTTTVVLANRPGLIVFSQVLGAVVALSWLSGSTGRSAQEIIARRARDRPGAERHPGGLASTV